MDGTLNDRGHPDLTLDALGLKALGATDPDVYERRQSIDRELNNGVFAQRGEHLADVLHECAIGSDNEDARPLEFVPMVVEQPGGSVERDGGLPGSRPALDD